MQPLSLSEITLGRNYPSAGYVCGIGLFSYLTYNQFWKNYAGRYIVEFVNKTSRD